MENRRKDYRHRLLPSVRLPVQLTCPGRPQAVVGDILDLSVAGLSVQIDGDAPALDERQPCLVHLVVAREQIDLTLQAIVVHVGNQGGAALYGLAFAPLASPAANDHREKILWRFLLEEQRRQRRRQAGGRRSAG